MALPTRGQPDWDDELGNHISGIEADVQSAKANASQAISNANEARNVAQSVKDAVLGGTDVATAGFINDDASATKAALSATYAGTNGVGKTLSATGNGVADDAAAFAAAIAAAPSGGVVVIPPAATEYLWTSTLDVTKPVTLRAPQGATVRIPTSGRLKISANNVTFEGITFVKAAAQPWLNLLAERTAPENRHTGIRFQRCKFDGLGLRFSKIGMVNPDGTTSSNGTDVMTPALVACEFTAYAENFTVQLGTTKDALVEGCWFHDYGKDSNAGDGVKVLSGSYGTRILNNVFENSTRDGIDLYDSQRNTIIGNTFRNMAALAIDAKWSATENANAPRQNIIMGNRAENCGSGGYHVATSDTLVSGNEARSCGYGFKASGSIDGSVTSTVRLSIVNNLAMGCTSDGFALSNVDGCTVVGNLAFNSGGIGISLGTTVANATIMGNIVSGSTLQDIDQGSTSSTVTLVGNVAGKNAAVSGTTVLTNNKAYTVRTAAGAVIEGLKMNTSDELVVGTSAVTNLRLEPKVSLQKALVRKRAAQTLAANGTVTIDVLASQIHEITLNANATSFTVSNAATGMEFEIDLIQDATGGRTYTFPAGFKFAGGAAPTDTTANTRTTVRFRAGGTSTFREVGRTVAVPA